VLWCFCCGAVAKVTGYPVTNDRHVSPRSCARSRCICSASQIPGGWKRRGLETPESPALCVGVLQQQQDLLGSCSAGSTVRGQNAHVQGVPRVSSSLGFCLFLKNAGWGLSQCVFCLQRRVRKARPVWSTSRPRICSPRKSS